MDLKPSEGLKVKVNAVREAIFGEDGVEVKRIGQMNEKVKAGVMTGRTIAGYSEVEMSTLDGKKHWYPIDQLVGEKGEKIVEEEIKIEIEQDSDEEEEEG